MIGFYGGEPLLNMSFVKEIINYLNEKYPSNHQYSMTTNGVLLKKHIDYLADKEFNLLISLDGDEPSNSYRLNCNGAPIFHQLLDNVYYIKDKRPLYFESHVNFNAVIHNRNKLPDILSFFKTQFNKTPNTGRLNSSGIHPDKMVLFNEISKNTSTVDYKNESVEEVIKKIFLVQGHLLFLHNNLFSVYKNYLEFLTDYTNVEIYPTATCMPMKKKMFLTVNGKILPCERVGHHYTLGNVSNGIVTIDFEDVANKFNEMYEKMFDNHCSTCRLLTNCSICMLQSDIKCPILVDEEAFFQSKIDFFESKSDIYHELLTNITIK
jgi:uncharacterized protein